MGVLWLPVCITPDCQHFWLDVMHLKLWCDCGCEFIGKTKKGAEGICSFFTIVSPLPQCKRKAACGHVLRG
jgi:hypothetical protein